MKHDAKEWAILNQHGRAISRSEGACSHGVTFDIDEAEKILGDWTPSNSVEFIMGNLKHAEVRRRWPRLDGPCPLGCGFNGIAYASPEHYVMGDW